MVPEFPGQYLISGAWSQVPEDLHSLYCWSLNANKLYCWSLNVDSPGLPMHASDMKTCIIIYIQACRNAAIIAQQNTMFFIMYNKNGCGYGCGL